MSPPTHTIIVDEAGNPPLREGSVRKGYVACAVAVRTELRDEVIAMLPRDPDTGDPLKAASRNHGRGASCVPQVVLRP